MILDSKNYRVNFDQPFQTELSSLNFMQIAY
jgi:hypothetical protein